jgi:tRNA (adenine22-N1)-methyltransferase
MKLSLRLQTIADLIPPNHSLGDIGSDHGYLIQEVIEKNKVPFAYACDNKKGPYERLKANLSRYSNVSVSLSSGLDKLPSNIETVSITGMGGELVSSILNNGKEKLKNVNYLVLGPQGNVNEVRKTINELGFKIDNEKLVFEDHYYTILVCSRGHVDYEDIDYEFGPILRNNQDELFIKMYHEELDLINRLLDNPQINETKKDLLKSRASLINSVIKA